MQIFSFTPPDFIFQWYERYEMAEFDKFIYLWMSFNAWLTKYTRTKSKNDRDMINEFKKSDKLNYIELRDSDSILRSEVEWLCEHGVFNYRNDSQIKPKSVDDFDAIIECIYTIKCNLFHGSYRRDIPIDRLAVSKGTEILARIYGPILKRERELVAKTQLAQWQAQKFS